MPGRGDVDYRPVAGGQACTEWAGAPDAFELAHAKGYSSGMSHDPAEIDLELQVPRVLILGASGELGGAIAQVYARSGARLSLWGRDMAKLDRISDTCRQLGAAQLSVCSLDLRQLDDAIAAAVAEDVTAPFDIAIVASGVGDIRSRGAVVEDAAHVARLVQVNFTAPAAIASALGDRMAARGRGSIVLVGSVAGFHSLPFATAYAGSKAGLARFADAVRIALRPHGVSVTLVSPGFIDTAAARKVPGPKPMMVSPQSAAQAIVSAARQGRAHLVMPWPFAILRLIDRVMPRFIRDRLLRSLTPPGR